jgi:hypothetical protein
MKRNNPMCFVALIGGVILTILFLVFKVEIYESIYYAQGFSDQMFNLDLYTVFAVMTVALAWIGAAVYYYVFNSLWGSKVFKRTNHWFNWLITLGVVVIVTMIACFAYNDYVFSENNLMYILESIKFEVCVLITSIVLFIIASYSLRWWSDQAYNTPIPQ